MKGIGTVNQIENPFWTLVGKEGVERNPLKYYCAPNQATPDYVTSYSVRDFIAYGFVCCWDAVCPAYFAMWNMVQQDDVQWLRHYFLEVLEAAVLAYYEGKLENGENFDWGDWSQSLNIGNSDEGDEEEIRYTWALDRVDDEKLAMVLAIANCVGTGPAGDDEVIWLAKEALEDRAKVKAAFEEAYAANKLHGKIAEHTILTTDYQADPAEPGKHKCAQRRSCINGTL